MHTIETPLSPLVISVTTPTTSKIYAYFLSHKVEPNKKHWTLDILSYHHNNLGRQGLKLSTTNQRWVGFHYTC